MTYSNPQLPEGINAGHDHPAKELFLFGGAILAVTVVFCIALFGAAQLLAPYVPFSWEQKLAGSLEESLELTPSFEDAATQRRLQVLADRLSAVMALPEDMSIRVYYLDDAAHDGQGSDRSGGTVNAFATLGGNVFIFAGLMRLLPDENALAMVMAHEIAHVKNRDVISGMSGGLLVGATLGLILGDAGAFATLGELTATLSALSYGRDREEAADAEALAALVALYGHAGGYRELFSILTNANAGSGDTPEFLSSHPDGARRIETLEALAKARGWPLEGTRTALR